MKHLLLTTIAAVVLVGCGPSVDIWEAARTGNIEAVKQHLAAGTDVNAKSVSGGTALHMAAWKGHKYLAELLIAKGADVNAYADNHATVLHQAATGGHKEIIELLIAEGADVNAKEDEYGITALHETSANGSKEVAELLISKGADVNAKDVDGETPLDAAESLNEDVPPEDKAAKKETADFLRKHGGKTGEELKVESINEDSSISKKLTAKEVAEIMAFNIGHWETNGEGMPVGGTKQAIEMRREVRWKEEDESLEYKYTMNQNGEVVSYFGHEEYDAAKGVFVYRSKWGESPETTSHASYNPATRTSHAQTVTTKSGAKTKTVTTTKRVGNDKIQQNLRVFENGQLVYTHDVVSTRIEENKQ